MRDTNRPQDDLPQPHAGEAPSGHTWPHQPRSIANGVLSSAGTASHSTPLNSPPPDIPTLSAPRSLAGDPRMGFP